jgi:outer membrane protein TolC
MYTFKTLLSVCLIFIFNSLQAQFLGDYKRTAAENNPGLKASYLEFEAAMQNVTQAKALPDPTLSFGYFISPVETRVGPQRARFSLTQMFPWFGTKGLEADVAEFNARAKYKDFQDQKNKLYYQVSAAYYPIYELKQQIRWQKENLEILETYKRLSTTSFSSGKGNMVDVIRVDIMIDEAETEIQLLEDQLRPLRIGFNRLLNRPDAEPVQVEDNIGMQEAVLDFHRDSISSNPLLQAFSLRMDAQQAAEQVAGRQGNPSFGVGLDYVIVDKRSGIELTDNGKDVLMPMVTMSLPIFRGKYQASAQEAKLQQQALQHRQEELENNLVADYESAQFDLVRAKDRYALYETQITKTRQAIELLKTSYANDGKEFEEILRMEQQLLKYQLSKAGAVKAYYLADARLNYITSNTK